MNKLILRPTCIAAGAACLAAALATSAHAGPKFKAEYVPAYVPFALLNDGRVVETAEVFNDTSRCAPGVPPISCVRQSTKTLGVASLPPLASVGVPYDFTARAIRVNSVGATASWPLNFDVVGADAFDGVTSDPTLYIGVSLPGGTVTAFAAPNGSLPRPTADARYAWRLLSNGGHLVGYLTSTVGSKVAVWNGQGTPSLVAPPSGFSNVLVADADAAGRVAVTLVNYAGGAEQSRAALVSGTGVKVLPLPFLSSWRRSEAVATNDRGEVLGNLIKDGASSAALWSSGFVFNLGTLPGFKNSIAMGLTSTGAVLACAYNEASIQGGILPVGETRMFVWNKGIRTPWENAVQAPPEAYNTSSCTPYIDSWSGGPHAQANQRGQLLLRSSTQALWRLTPLN